MSGRPSASFRVDTRLLRSASVYVLAGLGVALEGGGEDVCVPVPVFVPHPARARNAVRRRAAGVVRLCMD